MTTKKFDATPTAGEPINLEEISKESVQEAWKIMRQNLNIKLLISMI